MRPYYVGSLKCEASFEKRPTKPGLIFKRDQEIEGAHDSLPPGMRSYYVGLLPQVTQSIIQYRAHLLRETYENEASYGSCRAVTEAIGGCRDTHTGGPTLYEGAMLQVDRPTDMGWLRLAGSLKLYVSLENIGLFCRALLQKRPMILRSLLIIATPYEGAKLEVDRNTEIKSYDKFYVSLENIGLLCRALLQKRPIILRSLLIVATPYQVLGYRGLVSSE